MVPAFPRICVLAKLDGKEGSATHVFLCQDADMDTAYMRLNVYVILATGEDSVIFLSVENVLMDTVLIQVNVCALMVGKVTIAQNVYHWLDV